MFQSVLICKYQKITCKLTALVHTSQ